MTDGLSAAAGGLYGTTGRLLGRTRFAELAAAFPGRRIVVLGDVMLDRYVAGRADRVSPEAPVPVVRVEREWEAPGGAANVAANILSLGARCDILGVVGDDAAGCAVERILEGMGGGCRFVHDGNRETTVKTRVLARGRQVLRVDRERTALIPAPVRAALASRLRAGLLGAHGLVLADYDKGTLSPELIRSAIGAAGRAGVPVFADPKRRHFLDFAGATVLKPNRSEIEAAFAERAQPEDDRWMEAARERTGAEHLLLTLGADGMVLVSRGRAALRLRASARSVYDVSGAGDTVIAAMAVACAAGAYPPEAAAAAAHAAAISVGRVGVATIRPDALAARLPRNAAEA